MGGILNHSRSRVRRPSRAVGSEAMGSGTEVEHLKDRIFAGNGPWDYWKRDHFFGDLLVLVEQR